MIISHKHKFIFIHIHKCAGSSMTYALVPELGEDDLVLGVTEEGRRLDKIGQETKGLHKHSKAKEIKEFLEPEIWNNYFKFSFVRNPWDRLVSYYHWWLKTNWDNERGTAQKIKALDNFEEYLFSPYRSKNPCNDYLVDDEGNNLVDFVGKQERIYRDFAYVCGRIGLPNLNLPRRNQSQHKEYFKYYTPETINLVAEWFKADIENFKYSFKTGK